MARQPDRYQAIPGFVPSPLGAPVQSGRGGTVGAVAPQGGPGPGMIATAGKPGYFASLGGAPAASGGAGFPMSSLGSFGASLANILATIQHMESGGNPTAENPTSTASGLYQFTDPTWQGLLREFGVSGPSHAAYANPSLQSQIASQYVNQILSGHGNDPRLVPQIWHWGGGGYTSHPWDTYDQNWWSYYTGLPGGGPAPSGGAPPAAPSAPPPVISTPKPQQPSSLGAFGTPPRRKPYLM